jgi:hypothetical protein
MIPLSGTPAIDGGHDLAAIDADVAQQMIGRGHQMLGGAALLAMLPESLGAATQRSAERLQ